MVIISHHFLYVFNRLEKELEKAEKENQAHQKEVKILQLNKNLVNGYRLTDLTTWTKNRPIWLTIDGLKPTNDTSLSANTIMTKLTNLITSSTDKYMYYSLDSELRRLPLRLSKRQSPTTVLFRTTLTQTIKPYELQNKN